MAEWGLREEFKHYSRIAYIEEHVVEDSAQLARAKENADFLGIDFEVLDGSGDYLEKILFGPYDDDEFFRIPPGEAITQKLYLG